MIIIFYCRKKLAQNLLYELIVSRSNDLLRTISCVMCQFGFVLSYKTVLCCDLSQTCANEYVAMSRMTKPATDWLQVRKGHTLKSREFGNLTNPCNSHTMQLVS